MYATLIIKRRSTKVKHIALSKLLAGYNIPNEEIRLISNIYDNHEAQIRINNSLSRNVKIKQGVRQGCILSLILFNMYSEEVINRALESEKGIVINGKRLTNIHYADDTAILASSTHD